jgi:hypothetical protein
MAYTTIPTLSDGTILTASHLNLLADNANFLASLGGIPNLAFSHLATSTGGTQKWHMRHRHRYLYVNVVWTNNADYLRIYYNGTKIHDDGDPSGTDALKLDLNPLSLTVGTWYEIRAEFGFVAGSAMDLQLIWEFPT